MKKNVLEWSIFAISLVLIAVCVGVLGYEQLTRTDSPPNVLATIGQVMERPDGFAVEIIIENTGDRTASAIHLQLSDEANNEQATAVIEYLPYRSTRRAWLILPTDPRGDGIRVRVLGYEEP
jgi:uncharacterized protein (TIGR02588 family)